MKPKPPVAKWRWGIWYVTLGAALVLFYGLFTPYWFGSSRSRLAGGIPCAAPPLATRDIPRASDRTVRLRAFDEPTTGGRDLLGGKGIGLAEMTADGGAGPCPLHDHH